MQAQPTAWWSYSNLSPDDVAARVNEKKARLTDIRVENGSDGNLRFTVTMVANGGAYQSGWWWHFNQSRTDIDSLAATDNARPISVQKYWTGSTWRYAVVLVSNSGANYRKWTWNEGSASTVAWVTPAGYRMAAVSTTTCSLQTNCPTPSGSYFVAVYEENVEGFTAKFYHNEPASYLGKATAGAQLVDLDPNFDGTFNAITYSAPWTGWSWWSDYQSLGGLADRALQHGMRLIDVTQYWKNGRAYYAGIMVENLSGLAAKLRNMYDYGSVSAWGNTFDSGLPDGSSYGFRLKQWNGPVVAALQDDVKFDPASVLKVLIHLHALRNETYSAKTGVTEDTNIPYHYWTKP